MMDRGQADILVGDLAQQLGVPTLALDENGMCILAIDEGKVIVSIGYNRAAGSLDLMVCLDRVDPSPARVATALRANFERASGSAASLAAEPSTGAFVLQRRWFTPDLGDGGLPAAVLSFIDEAEAWTARLNEVGNVVSENTLPSGLLGVRA
jgi:hypothetical protein